MKRNCIYLLLLCVVWLSPRHLSAQNDTTFTYIFKIELNDGSVLIGNIHKQNSSSISIITLSGLHIDILKSQIADLELYDEEYSYSVPDGIDPNNNRLFLSPTGRPLKKGQAYFSVYELFFPFIGGGITNNFSMAGGVSLIPNASRQLIYIAPKLTPLVTEIFSFSTGVYFLFNPFESVAMGIAYGAGTLGNDDNGITIGVGYDFSDEEITDKPILVFGGEFRISEHIKFISENWLISRNNGNLLSFGLRFFGESFAGDFAMIYPTESRNRGFPFLPWVGFTYNF